MDHPEYQYLNIAKEILNQGKAKSDRTGVGTLSVFGVQMRFDLAQGFPLLTTKKVHFKSIVGELLWFLSGSTNNNDLVDKYGVTIWNEWARPDGDLGPVYGHGWRQYMGPYKQKDGSKVSFLKKVEYPNGETETYNISPIDQIDNLVQEIKKNPNSRRLVVTPWNPLYISEMALPPCHTMFQFEVSDGKLSCHLFQRSGDFFLGVPYNIASYSLLTHMIAHVTNLKVGTFVHSISDAHIYMNHIEQIQTQIQRNPYPFPDLHLNLMQKDIFSFGLEDIMLHNYQSHPSIKAPVAV